MPNWVYNEVEIAAPLTEVQAYLFEIDDPESTRGGKVHVFNLHRLYPERFEADDQQGLKAWNYGLMTENVGTKWNPHIAFVEESAGKTQLAFDTAWAPPLELLERWHQLTRWTIHNDFEEEQPEFDGGFHCE